MIEMTLPERCQHAVNEWYQGAHADRIIDKLIDDAATDFASGAYLETVHAVDEATPENLKTVLDWSRDYPIEVARWMLDGLQPTLALILADRPEQVENTRLRAGEAYLRILYKLQMLTVLPGGRA